MFLSSLEINSNNRIARSWLSNAYRIHQRLLMAFPDGDAGRVLFRIDQGARYPRIIVQSPMEADWEKAFADLPVLAAHAQKPLLLQLQQGQRLRFLLRANPTMRLKGALDAEDREERKPGKRVGMFKEEDQRRWLERKGEAGGFRPLAFDVRPGGTSKSFRTGEKGVQSHLSVDYEGYLEILDTDTFLETLENGIGTAKGYGFGLLSIAPASGFRAERPLAAVG